ncbi:hypothetical protein ACRALDRAFT_2097912 [Sodiomyces alcalophilus JCM 7366]|uniref:uncharacterized protein n=1 Tax=Sodiomyces alcalophilus JCM 7366 TaxID=591952 RepID=UPI0039B41CDA
MPSSAQPTKGKDAPVLPQPVLLHSTPAAQAGRYLHLVVLLGVFGSQFNSLVEDPVRTLQNTLPLVAVIQVAYVLVCLPVAGSQAIKAARKPRPGEKRKQEHTGPNPYVALFLSLVLTALVTPATHLAFVLFGAPFLTHIPQTLLLSSHLALLALFPLFYAHGVDSGAWRAIGGAMAPFDETFGGCAGAVFGAWLGAIPIPLDWDREWQKWPVTILCGLYAGYAVGKILGGSVLLGRRMVSNTVKED